MTLIDFLNWQTNGNHKIAIYCNETVARAVKESDYKEEFCVVELYPDCERFTHRIIWKDFYECWKKSDREVQENLDKPIIHIGSPKIKKSSVKSYLKDLESGDITNDWF